MVNTPDKGTAASAVPLPDYGASDHAAEHDAAMITELVATAIARLNRDVSAYHQNKPAIAYALAGETHAAIMHQWRQYKPEAQIALLAALLDEATALLHQLQLLSARIVPSNGYMFGLQDEAMKLEAQADITLEEIHRIEAELRVLKANNTLQ
jgi:hypothetical protein